MRRGVNIIRSCAKLTSLVWFVLISTSTSPALATDFKPTLDTINGKVPSFLSGEHGKYLLRPAPNDDPTEQTILIDGTTYYYTPGESTLEKNNILNYLANTAQVSITTTGATEDNHVFRISNGGSTYTYYTFDTQKLPASAWEATAGTDSNYAFILPGSGTESPQYQNINLKTGKMSSVGNLTFEKSNGPASEVDFNPDTGTGTGTIAVGLPHNGSITEGYYTYTYTVPSGYTQQNSRLTNLNGNVENKYFYNISTSSNNGGAISNTSQNKYNIIADFIRNHMDGTKYGGGAISNEGKLGRIIGTFIGNYSKVPQVNGGVLRNKKSNSKELSFVEALIGNFIGNYAYGTGTDASKDKAEGGAINNEGVLKFIIGNFTGNYTYSPVAVYGGAIRNVATINSIISNFIGNYAHQQSDTVDNNN